MKRKEMKDFGFIFLQKFVPAYHLIAIAFRDWKDAR